MNLPKVLALILLAYVPLTSAEEAHLVVPGAGKEAVKKIHKLKNSPDLKVSSSSRRVSSTPSVEFVEAFLQEAGIDTSEMDMLDKDMFVMAIYDWELEKVIKRYEDKVPPEDIKKAYEMARGSK